MEKNLRMAFADKTDNDRLLIEHKFYHWLCDYFVESIKLLSISKEELQLIYLGLHTISTSYVIKGDLESVFLNLLDKVSIEIDK